MITAIIPTYNSGKTLARSLSSLVPAVVDGIVRQVVVSDGGSVDVTRLICEEMGAEFVTAGPPGRGTQLEAGGQLARGEWLLFLHADTELQPGWEITAVDHIERTRQLGTDRAAVFRFRLNDAGARPRLLEKLVGLRTHILRLPYGDQGLLIKKSHYERIGGFKPFPLMEDVDIIRRIGGRNFDILSAFALTSAEKFRQEGYVKRSMKNVQCLILYYMGVPPARLIRFYEGQAFDERS